MDVSAGRCEPVENLMKRPQDLYGLCDDDFIVGAIREDPILKMVMAIRSRGGSRELARPVTVSFGIPEELVADQEAGQWIRTIHTQAALFASRKVIEWTEALAASSGRKLMVVLSFGKENVPGISRGESDSIRSSSRGSVAEASR